MNDNTLVGHASACYVSKNHNGFGMLNLYFSLHFFVAWFVDWKLEQIKCSFQCHVGVNLKSRKMIIMKYWMNILYSREWSIVAASLSSSSSNSTNCMMTMPNMSSIIFNDCERKFKSRDIVSIFSNEMRFKQKKNFFRKNCVMYSIHGVEFEFDRNWN